MALDEEESTAPYDDESEDAFFLFFPEPRLALLLLAVAPPLPPLAELGVTGAEEAADISLGLKDDDLLVLLLLEEEEERDLSARPEARGGAAEEEEEEWAEGICGDEDTCRACVMP